MTLGVYAFTGGGLGGLTFLSRPIRLTSIRRWPPALNRVRQRVVVTGGTPVGPYIAARAINRLRRPDTPSGVVRIGFPS